MSDVNTTDMYDALNAGASEGTGTKSDDSAKKKLKDLKDKRRAIDDAKKIRDANSWDERWSNLVKIYANRYPYNELADYEDVVVPNMAFSTVNVIVPSIAINNPKITVTASQMEDVDTAEVVEAVVNHQWRTYDVQPEVRAAVKDFVIIGHGWVKVVWETEESMQDVPKEELLMQIQQALMQKDQAVAQGADPEMFPDDTELINSIPDQVMATTKDQPLVLRRSPFDIFVDPDAKVLRDARWIAERSFWPLEVAKVNQDWDEAVRSRVVARTKGAARDKVEVEDKNEQSDQSGFVEVWEFYDLVENTMCTFADGTDGFLIAPDDSPFPDGHPFVFLENYEVPERFYPIGDVETIYPLQLELAIARTAQVNDRKRGRRITLFREAALGAQGVEDLRSGKDNVMIPVLKDRPFDEVFQQVSSMGLQPEWYRADQQAMDDINLVSGVSEYARGGTSDIRRTATEVGVTQDYANARSSDKLAKVEAAMASIAERMIKLSQQFMDTQAVAKVVTDTQAVAWVQYDRDAIQGDFSFVVEAGSSQPNNESFRRQQAMQMMDTFGQFIGSGYLNDQEFLAQIMRLNGWNDVEKFLGPGPMPPPMVGPDGQPLPPESQGMPGQMPGGVAPVGPPPAL